VDILSGTRVIKRQNDYPENNRTTVLGYYRYAVFFQRNGVLLGFDFGIAL
jgi:hypothetical protein